MPTTSVLPSIAQTSRRLSPAELQQERVRLRAQERQAVDRRAAEMRVLWSLKRLLQTARDYGYSEADRKGHEDTMADLAAEEPRVLDRGVAETVRAVILAPVAAISIGVIDVALLGAASQFIMSLVYAHASAEQPLWTLFIIGPSLLAFELFVASCLGITAAEQALLDSEQSRRANPALILAWILAIVVPSMAAATMLDALDGQQAPAVNALLIIGVVALGGCVHGGVLFFGNRGRDAAVLLVNRHRFGRQQRLANAAQRSSLRLRDLSRDGLRGYHTAAAAYRLVAGEVPPHLGISELDASAVNTAVGAQVVRVSTAGGAGIATNPRPGNEPQLPVPPDGEHPTEQGPASTGPTGTGDPMVDDLSEQVEYYRRAMQGRQADADGEIN